MRLRVSQCVTWSKNGERWQVPSTHWGTELMQSLRSKSQLQCLLGPEGKQSKGNLVSPVLQPHPERLSLYHCAPATLASLQPLRTPASWTPKARSQDSLCPHGWRNEHGFRVCLEAEMVSCCSQYGGGEHAGPPGSLSTWSRAILTSTQVLLFWPFLCQRGSASLQGKDGQGD